MFHLESGTLQGLSRGIRSVCKVCKWFQGCNSGAPRDVRGVTGVDSRGVAGVSGVFRWFQGASEHFEEFECRSRDYQGVLAELQRGFQRFQGFRSSRYIRGVFQEVLKVFLGFGGVSKVFKAFQG